MGLCAGKGGSGKSSGKSLSNDTVLKILLVGDSAVGKTSLLCQFADSIFSEEAAAAIEVDFPNKLKEITLNRSKVKVQVWDTAGQEKFRTITASYYRGAHGIIIVYDITNKESFKNVKHWIRDVELYASENVNRMVVGNKADLLNRQVKKEEGKAVADDLGVPFMETSAKDGMNVQEAFNKLAAQVFDRLVGDG